MTMKALQHFMQFVNVIKSAHFFYEVHLHGRRVLMNVLYTRNTEKLNERPLWEDNRCEGLRTCLATSEL